MTGAGAPSVLCGLGLAAAVFALAMAPGARAADAVTGTWGAVAADGNGQPKCAGTAVRVFHQGRHFRVLPNVGSTGGTNQLILSQSTYRLTGDRLVVAQALSFTNPEPRRVFLVQRVGEPALILQGKEQVVFKPCPPIDPKGLDRVVK